MNENDPADSPLVEFAYTLGAADDPAAAEAKMLAFEKFLAERGLDGGNIDRDDPDDQLSNRLLLVPLLGASSLLEGLVHAGFTPDSVRMGEPDLYSRREFSEEARSLVELAKAVGIPRQPADAIDEVIAEFSEQVSAYRAGEQQHFGFLLGEVMRRCDGRADVRLVNEILQHRLG